MSDDNFIPLTKLSLDLQAAVRDVEEIDYMLMNGLEMDLRRDRAMVAIARVLMRLLHG